MPNHPITDLCIAQSSQRIEAVEKEMIEKLNTNGTLTVTIRHKLTKLQTRVHDESSITLPSEKTVDEGEDSADCDVNQIKLPV